MPPSSADEGAAVSVLRLSTTAGRYVTTTWLPATDSPRPHRIRRGIVNVMRVDDTHPSFGE